VQLVDEDDGAALVGRDLLEHGLQALLELAAVLGSGQQGGHVERQHALVLERVGHLAVDDTLREALDDGGLAHARLADQHRVVLGAALQDLDGAADLVVAADHRIELAGAGALGQVDGVLLERLALALGLGAADGLPTAHRLDRRLELLAVQAGLARDAARVALVVGQREQHHLGGDVLVAAPGGLLLGEVQQPHSVAPDLDVAAGP
jgi:hypothetical protein